MKNIFKMINIADLKLNLLNVIKRFPLSIAIILIVSCVFFYILHNSSFNQIEINENLLKILIKINLSGIISFFLSIGINILGEIFNFNNLKRNLLQLITLLFGIGFFIGFSTNFDEIKNFLFFIITITGIIGFILFVPYTKYIIKNEVNQENYYNYFYKVIEIFFISSALGIIIFILGSVGIATIEILFDLGNVFGEKIYGDLAILSFSIISTLLFLILFPKKEDFEKKGYINNLFFESIVKYISIPFIYIYFIILYVYSIKVIINFGDWPKGEVSWMVIGFSIFGYLIYLFSYSLQENNKYIKFFRNWLPFVIIPQIFMLFYAIYLRIAQYDLTINRYFVIVFGIWLTIISLYFIISKKKYIVYIPLIISIFTIIISIGPWGVYSLPKERQLLKLKNDLIKASILVNGEIIPLKKYDSISTELSKSIYSEIEYICDFDNCKDIIELFPKQYKEIEIDGNNTNIFSKSNFENEKRLPNKYEIISGISEKIKVRFYYNGNVDNIIYLKIDETKSNIFPIDINGFSKIASFGNFDENNLLYDIKVNSYSNNPNIEIYSNGNLIDKLNLKEFNDYLIKKYLKDNLTDLNKKDLTFESKGNKGSYKIIFSNYYIKNPSFNGEIKDDYYNVRGYILIK